MIDDSSEENRADRIHIDGERLVTYLYDESEPVERARVGAHLDVCGSCREEMAALGATREHLAGWRPPNAALGFQLGRQAESIAAPGVVLRPPQWWARPLPAWAQVAAAILIFGAGLSIGARGLDRSAGASRPDETSARPVPAVARVSASASASPVDDLAREVQLLRAELGAVRTPATAASVRPDPALMRQLQALIEESEHRQRNEFTLRAAQLLSDLDAQLRGDLTRINQRVTSVEGTTNGLARAVSATVTQPLVAAPR
jgi:hypothetical protein